MRKDLRLKFLLIIMQSSSNEFLQNVDDSTSVPLIWIKSFNQKSSEPFLLKQSRGTQPDSYYIRYYGRQCTLEYYIVYS